MALEITPDVTIPDSDLTYAFVRASGPGGQNVNKVSSAVQLRFDMEGSTALSEPVKNRLRVLAGRRLTDDGAILIIARNQRSQEHNRREALERAAEVLGLVGLPNILLTPHTAGATWEAQHGLASLAADNLIAALGLGPDAGKPPSILNPEVLTGRP